jgi:hypothetical protein
MVWLKDQWGQTRLINPETFAHNLCPLCNKDNCCGNISACGSKTSCWCRSPEINFPAKLLNQIPNAVKNKACICKACALAYQE